MTEFEFFQMWRSYIEMFVGTSMNALAVFLPYVAVAFLVGKDLSRKVALGLSVIYSLFTLGPVTGMINGIAGTLRTATQYHAQFPDGLAIPESPPSAVLYVFVLVPVVVGWVGSLVYMHQVVRGGTA